MKKSLPKKLTLQRDTVLNLQPHEIQDVKGGAPTQYSCINSCDTATRWACSLGTTC